MTSQMVSRPGKEGETFADRSLPRIELAGKCLTVIVAADGAQYCGFCPELDLVTEMPTPELVMEDMLEAMQEYAEEFLKDIALYRKSANRAHHLPYVRAIVACDDTWDLRMLIEVLHGRIHV